MQIKQSPPTCNKPSGKIALKSIPRGSHLSMLMSIVMTTLFILSIGVPSLSRAQKNHYSADDLHNHDGSHPDSPSNCGTNYMLPHEIARLGSHSFMILGKDGENHIIAEHRSGTPPHNYQFLLRIRLDQQEMKAYERIAKESKTLPAFTTIYFDQSLQQRERTFFCLADLPKIFGEQKKKGDSFEKLFPIHASLQKNPDHEGSFDIKNSISRGDFFSIDHDDVELLVDRYLPAYLPQDALRKAIKEREKEIIPLLSHAPLTADEAVVTASKRISYIASDAVIASPGKFCPRNDYLKNEPVPETIHTFLLLAEIGPNSILATHYYDQAPQNFQTVLKLKLSDEEMKIWRLARKHSTVPPVFQTRVISGNGGQMNSTFCMENIRALLRKGKDFSMVGTVYQDSTLDDYHLGKAVGVINIGTSDIEVLVNRRLESFMNPIAVAKDVLTHLTKKKKTP